MSKYLNKLIVGDCIKGIKEIPDEFVHLILSDIPYGIGAEDWDVLHDNKKFCLPRLKPWTRKKQEPSLRREASQLMDGLKQTVKYQSNTMSGAPLGQKNGCALLNRVVLFSYSRVAATLTDVFRH